MLLSTSNISLNFFYIFEFQDESEYSDDPSEQQFEDDTEQQGRKQLSVEVQQLSKDDQLAARLEKKITSRLEDYFMAGLGADPHQSLGTQGIKWRFLFFY